MEENARWKQRAILLLHHLQLVVDSLAGSAIGRQFKSRLIRGRGLSRTPASRFQVADLLENVTVLLILFGNFPELLKCVIGVACFRQQTRQRQASGYITRFRRQNLAVFFDGAGVVSAVR